MPRAGRVGRSPGVPPLIELLNAEESGLWGRRPDTFDGLIRPVVMLRAKEAVPVLLRHLDNPNCIAALGELGNARVAARSKQLVAAKGENS